jgi:hypothetical protein
MEPSQEVNHPFVKTPEGWLTDTEPAYNVSAQFSTSDVLHRVDSLGISKWHNSQRSRDREERVGPI